MQTGYYYQILTDKEGRTKFTIEKAASVKDGTGYDTNGISCGKAFPTADEAFDALKAYCKTSGMDLPETVNVEFNFPTPDGTFKNYNKVWNTSEEYSAPTGGNPEGENPEGGNPEGENPEGGNPEGEKPEGGNPEGENPEGGNPEGENPEGGNPEGEKPEGGNPEGENPEGGNPKDGGTSGTEASAKSEASIKDILKILSGMEGVTGFGRIDSDAAKEYFNSFAEDDTVKSYILMIIMFSLG